MNLAHAVRRAAFHQPESWDPDFERWVQLPLRGALASGDLTRVRVFSCPEGNRIQIEHRLLRVDGTIYIVEVEDVNSWRGAPYQYKYRLREAWARASVFVHRQVTRASGVLGSAERVLAFTTYCDLEPAATQTASTVVDQVDYRRNLIWFPGDVGIENGMEVEIGSETYSIETVAPVGRSLQAIALSRG